MRLIILGFLIIAYSSAFAHRMNSYMRTVTTVAARIGAWAWFFVAGIGGLALLIHQGPLPITNGWFAMFSGIAACPLLAWLVKRYSGVAISAHVQFLAALLILIAGRISVVFVLHRPFLPQ
jgi:TctA family transporter